jgi:hypothetical protein
MGGGEGKECTTTSSQQQQPRQQKGNGSTAEKSGVAKAREAPRQFGCRETEAEYID